MNRDRNVTDIELSETEDLSAVTYFDFYDFVKPLCSTTQVKIATFLFQGFTKEETAALLALSQTQLRTQIKHMAQLLQAESVPSKDTKRKMCSHCGNVKSASDFGHDSRAADGRQSRCLPCERARKQAHKTFYRNCDKTA